jgi:hypothetical protein
MHYDGLLEQAAYMMLALSARKGDRETDERAI